MYISTRRAATIGATKVGIEADDHGTTSYQLATIEDGTTNQPDAVGAISDGTTNQPDAIEAISDGTKNQQDAVEAISDGITN